MNFCTITHLYLTSGWYMREGADASSLTSSEPNYSRNYVQEKEHQGYLLSALFWHSSGHQLVYFYSYCFLTAAPFIHQIALHTSCDTAGCAFMQLWGLSNGCPEVYSYLDSMLVLVPCTEKTTC